jgi:hypothetical protein
LQHRRSAILHASGSPEQAAGALLAAMISSGLFFAQSSGGALPPRLRYPTCLGAHLFHLFYQDEDQGTPLAFVEISSVLKPIRGHALFSP